MNFKIENVMNCVQCWYHSIIVLFDKDADRVSQLEIFYCNKNKSDRFRLLFRNRFSEIRVLKSITYQCV